MIFHSGHVVEFSRQQFQSQTAEETISNTRRRPSSPPRLGTHHFSICIGDQPSLDFGGQRNPDGQGFAAFAKVL
jgi:peptidyl-prolyl cis-trans isomerase A (cyclophilin A)